MTFLLARSVELPAWWTRADCLSTCEGPRWSVRPLRSVSDSEALAMRIEMHCKSGEPKYDDRSSKRCSCQLTILPPDEDLFISPTPGTLTARRGLLLLHVGSSTPDPIARVADGQAADRFGRLGVTSTSSLTFDRIPQAIAPSPDALRRASLKAASAHTRALGRPGSADPGNQSRCLLQASSED